MKNKKIFLLSVSFILVMFVFISFMSFFDKDNAKRYIFDLQNKANTILNQLIKSNTQINFDFLKQRMEFVVNTLLNK